MQLHSQNKQYTMGMRNSSTMNSQEVQDQQSAEMHQEAIAIQENVSLRDMYNRGVERADMEDGEGMDQR